MADHEKAFNQWKADTRSEALEKELKRLQTETRVQDNSLRKYKVALVIAILAAVASWTTFLIVGNKDTANSKEIKTHKESTTYTNPTNINTESAPKQGKDEAKKIKIINPFTPTIEFLIPEDGLFFSIQIGAFSGIDLNKFSNNMVALHQYSNAGINQFTLGIFADYDQALMFRNLIKKIGFRDAYITAIQNGHRINIQEAIKIRLRDSSSQN
jgi:hypothetical protein